jgi:hypothetical protein
MSYIIGSILTLIIIIALNIRVWDKTKKEIFADPYYWICIVCIFIICLLMTLFDKRKKK